MTGQIGRTKAVALLGVVGRVVEVEAHLAAQLPGLTIIGLPDTALGEARERVRAAAANAGSALPSRRIVVNLTPASVPKHGSGFDLAIAIAVLVAAGVVPDGVAKDVFIGELGLDGRVRPVPGIIPMLLAARSSGIGRVVVPWGNYAEASAVPGVMIEPVVSLRQAAVREGAQLSACPGPEPEPVAAQLPTRAATGVGCGPDIADVVGHDQAVRALAVAAAGRHHMLLLGPPGAGKTMLAERLPGLLPDLDSDAALEVAAVRSVAGFGADAWTNRPPWEAPHHSASAVALTGGGSGTVRPGAISMATRGVLFLDEAPEFPRAVLDALRQPLESGEITVHRAFGRATFPARCQLVLAANPCPCGHAGEVSGPQCVCPPSTVLRYRGRLSGPLLDRIDLRLAVRRVRRGVQHDARAEVGRSTERVRGDVCRARERAAHRLRDTPWAVNAQVSGSWLRGQHAASGAFRDLDRGLNLGTLTMRGWDRVARVAWTLADLDDAANPTREHVRQALAMRSVL